MNVKKIVLPFEFTIICCFFLLSSNTLSAQLYNFQFGISVLDYPEEGAKNGTNTYWSVPLYSWTHDFHHKSKEKGGLISIGTYMDGIKSHWISNRFNTQEESSIINIGIGIGFNFYIGKHLFDKGSIGFDLRYPVLFDLKNKRKMIFDDALPPEHHPEPFTPGSGLLVGVNYTYKHIGLFLFVAETIFEDLRPLVLAGQAMNDYSFTAQNLTFGITINPNIIKKPFRK